MNKNGTAIFTKLPHRAQISTHLREMQHVPFELFTRRAHYAHMGACSSNKLCMRDSDGVGQRRAMLFIPIPPSHHHLTRQTFSLRAFSWATLRVNFALPGR